jgi:hypothetical protein
LEDNIEMDLRYMGGSVSNWIDLAQNRDQWKALVNMLMILRVDRLCFLVVRVRGYRSRGPGSIPGATRFSEK